MGNKPDSNKKVNSTNKYLKFSGLAFQLAILLFIAIWAGGKLDVMMNNKQSYMTSLFVAVAFAGFMYNLFRDLENMK